MPPLAAVPDLERELDALYDLPLEEFTKARNHLVSRLRKAHQAEAAETVKALKKPTVVAWTANRLARDEPKRVRELLAAGEQLRETQQRALAGNASPDEVADAAAAEREAVRALVAAARDAVGSRATPQLLDRLSQTLRTAAVDAEASRLLERGRLTEELKGIGFGGLEAVRPARRRTDELARAARERVKELRAEAKRLAKEAADADRVAREAERTADTLRRDADERAAAAEQAATELAAAEESLGNRRRR
jgi:hypothetical protein